MLEANMPDKNVWPHCGSEIQSDYQVPMIRKIENTRCGFMSLINYALEKYDRSYIFRHCMWAAHRDTVAAIRTKQEEAYARLSIDRREYEDYLGLPLHVATELPANLIIIAIAFYHNPTAIVPMVIGWWEK